MDATEGRFLSRDPVGVDAGPNLYEYALDRPTVLVDPSGRVVEVCCDPIRNLPTAGTLAGGVLGGLINPSLIGAGAAVGRFVAGLPQHCWVNVKCFNKLVLSTELQPGIGLIPGAVWPRFRAPQGALIGVPLLTRRPGTKCTPCTSPWCIPGAPPLINAVLAAAQCAAEVACIVAMRAAYPIGTYNPVGSNSNTYAATVARACCKKPLPAGIPPLGPGQVAPGWNAAPPAPIPGVVVVKHA
jgi:hypothetical protein